MSSRWYDKALQSFIRAIYQSDDNDVEHTDFGCINVPTQRDGT